jgi:hypothetical protein
MALDKKLSFLIFNFGHNRLKNLWHTMNCVAKIRKANPELNDKVEFVVIEHGEQEYSKRHSLKTGFEYVYYFDPLLTSHRSSLRNKAVEEAKGDWVILHDNDIIPTPDFFESIFKVIENDNLDVDYFSNFKDVINLTDKLTNTLIRDVDSNVNKFNYGYVNGTDPEKTKNFKGCPVRPHGFFEFTEASGGSFTIKRDVYIKYKFDDHYDGWGAEDNAFKLDVITGIGWDRFGMLDQTLLHSYHTTGTFDSNSGRIIVNEYSLTQNRQKFFELLHKSEMPAKASEFISVQHEDLTNLIITKSVE